MPARLLDGRPVAAEIRSGLKTRVERLAAAGVVPGLATILVGDDPGSKAYVGSKHKKCKELGINSFRFDFPHDASKTQVFEAIEEINDDDNIDAALIQYPLPPSFDFTEAVVRVAPAKDVDGLHPMNLGYLALGEPDHPRPCTPVGIVELLMHYGIALEGQNVVILGRGMTVGRTLAILLSLKGAPYDATVVQCHSATADTRHFTVEADIVVAATGRPWGLTASDVKPGAIVVDVGVSKVDGELRGDVDPGVHEIASWVSPNPGGVGPMTIAMLLSNTVDAATRRAATLGLAVSGGGNARHG